MADERVNISISTGETPPPCENHKEVQHRDQKPPWCNACGWNHGREAVQARQLGSPHMKGTIPDGGATPKIY